MSSPEYTGLCKLLYDWQTIVAALLAILAAIIATFPVWQQLTGSSGAVGIGGSRNLYHARGRHGIEAG